MHRVCDELGPISLRLSRVLDDVGVCESMMGRRRRTYLQRETIDTIISQCTGLDRNTSYYCFGSQSEATTTPQMGSDLDILICYNKVNLMQDWHEWQVGKYNYLMIQDETTPPRHRSLQMLRNDSPEPVTTLDGHCIYDQIGRVLLKNNWLDDETKQLYSDFGDPYVRQGPSRSWTKDVDIIAAFRCNTLPRECQIWLDRPRPGHWPTPDMLREAQECGCFLLPVGHPESEEYEPVEWRLSPSLIERMLMFRLNVVQLKCYVTLKLIKISLLKPIVGDHLTSFHCKTALFYTIENSPPKMWKENNLLKCVQWCLRTLSKFLHKGFCPHYIIPDMNLFAGKLSRHEQHKLNIKVKTMLDCNLDWLYTITCDQIGPRLRNITTVSQRVVNDQFPTRVSIHADLAASLHLVVVEYLYNTVTYVLHELAKTCHIPSDVTIKLMAHLQALLLTDDPSFLEQHVAASYIPHICSTLASIQASISMYHSLPISPQTLSLFQISLNTDVASSRLKFASMLYCKGQYEVTASVFQDVENRYGDHVHAICGCEHKHENEERTRSFTSHSLMSTDTVVKRDCVAYCVRFLRLEAFCVPEILLYEMFRSIGDDIRYMDLIEQSLMDVARVDALPYLYYLQYLTYRELGRRDQQLTAIHNLRECFLPGHIKQLYHPETAANLLGHCYEMENMLDMAYDWYQQSLNNRPRNNAANRHILRLMNH